MWLLYIENHGFRNKLIMNYRLPWKTYVILMLWIATVNYRYKRVKASPYCRNFVICALVYMPETCL